MGDLDDIKKATSVDRHVEGPGQKEALPSPEAERPDATSVAEQTPAQINERIGVVDAKIGSEMNALNETRARLGLEPTDSSVAINALKTQRTELVRASGGPLEQNSTRTIRDALKGEVLGKDDAGPEDPRVTARFAELPDELRDVMTSMDRRNRRLAVDDQSIIDMPYEELYRLANISGGDTSLEEQLHLHGEENWLYGGEPIPQQPSMKDVTPRPARLEGSKEKKLNDGTK